MTPIIVVMDYTTNWIRTWDLILKIYHLYLILEGYFLVGKFWKEKNQINFEIVSNIYFF